VTRGKKKKGAARGKKGKKQERAKFRGFNLGRHLGWIEIQVAEKMKER